MSWYDEGGHDRGSDGVKLLVCTAEVVENSDLEDGAVELNETFGVPVEVDDDDSGVRYIRGSEVY
jgi:hypothetical protein